MDKLFKAFFRTKAAPTSVVTFGNGFESVADINNLRAYRESLYLYIGVSMIAKRVAGIPLELYKIKNKKGDVAEVFDHPLLELLHNPNDLQSPREFMELSISHYLLSGDCFWLLDRSGPGVGQMAILRPDFVEVVLSIDKKTIIAYEYRNERVYRFAPEDIIHFRNPDPINQIRGLGVVQPARSRIVSEIEATNYQANFFKNQGRPDFAVFADKDVNDDEGEHFRSRWKRIFGGKNAGSVGVFGQNVKSIQELNKTPKEMDFLESQRFLRDDILAALRIPKAMVTSDDVNLANAKEAYRIFLQEAVKPVLEVFVDTINTRLVPLLDSAVFFAFTDPTPVDREMLLKETKELKQAGIITANEARAMYNYEPLEGADTLATSNQPALALAETAKSIIRRRPILAKKLDAIEKIAALVVTAEPKRRMNSIFPTQEAKERYAKAYNDSADRKAEQIKAEVDAFHEGMLERILKGSLSPEGFMDVVGEKTTAKAIFAPLLLKLYKEAGQSALDALWRKAEGEHFFVDAVLTAAIEERAAFFTNSIIDTTFEVVKAQIVEGVKEGFGVDKIAANIKQYFEDMTTKRARTIAQTESNYVLSKATDDAYSQSAVVTGKEWLTVGDDRVRPEHVLNNGAIVAKGQAFPNGELHPAHTSVNCRCVLLPTV